MSKSITINASDEDKDKIEKALEEKRKINNKPVLKIGYHLCRSNNTLKQSLSTMPDLTPCQIFARAPQSGKCGLSDIDITECSHLITSKSMIVFIHSIYTVNLSNPFTKTSPINDSYALGLVTGDLQIGAKMGCKGVVVHVGKHVTKTEVEGLNRMTESILKILPYATEECPLLLETPAGQGTELLCKVEQFISYYLSFSEEDRKKFKLCIDSCHIYACGYDPLYYLMVVEHYCTSKAISLIHFNDSEYPKGCRKDRHADIGHGYIGKDALMQVAAWAQQRNIPLVKESRY